MWPGSHRSLCCWFPLFAESATRGALDLILQARARTRTCLNERGQARGKM